MTHLKYLALLLLSSILLGCATGAPRQPAPVYESGAVVNNRASVNNTTRSRTPAPIQDHSMGANDPQRNWNTPPVSANASPRTHTVQRGETLYGIARTYNVDRQDITDLNDLPSNTPLYAGQVLVLPVDDTQPIATQPDVVINRAGTVPMKTRPVVTKQPYSANVMTRKAPIAPVAAAVDPADESLQWLMPAEGQLVGGFSETGLQKGLEIFGEFGQPVVASAGGEVVYSGTGLRGYGKLILIKHNATYITAYAHNSRLLAKQGQVVAGGEKIAEMGNTDTNRVKLYFEIRRFGKPVDPAKYLRLN